MVFTPSRKTIRLSRSAYQEGHPFLVTINASQRYPWFRLYPELSDMSVRTLIELAKNRNADLYAWCVMPDHVHLLVRDANIIDFVRLFKGKLTPVARQLEASRPLWQRSFFDHVLRREESLESVALYVWNNPVRGGIAKNPREHKWYGSQVWQNWKEILDENVGEGFIPSRTRA